ncbi:hypothetical protein HYALB_00010734 [Hymenoscyphus albidus]|uniref:Methyltransferase type 11 domain-containing protein n=1 Tax=Hymenoscyphus albidus TaxID=595503 RepID=A0A9N9QAC3_9HELO|nr:hypothetical protein HYALB_00010734 [Hymenoscyphus albidus]
MEATSPNTAPPGSTNTIQPPSISQQDGNPSNSSTIQQESSSNPAQYEEQHVHTVYNEIAPHFSSTRYKPWPIVKTFLQSQPPGSLGLDIGCGNGKYLPINPSVFIIASDRSSGLIKFASQHQPHSAIIADTLALPHPRGKFDFAICIAVVHHLSTAKRRRQAVHAILETLSGKGKALIYAWALEQRDSRRGWDEGSEQDVMVPWVMKKAKRDLAEGEKNETTFQRYYHLYRKGEMEENVEAARGVVVEAGYEKDNWWVICSRGKGFEEGKEL